MSAVQVREAKQDDIPGMVRVRIDTWKAAYEGILSDDLLNHISHQDIEVRWKQTFWEERNQRVTLFVAENEQLKIIGIAVCGPEQTDDPIYHGEIYVLYVLPAYQNQGIGCKLVSACVQHLWQTLDMETMLVWVIADNPYRRFYESLGGKQVREKNEEIGGRMISEAGYGWEKLQELQSALHNKP